MTSTVSAYLTVTQNLARYQAMTAAEPAVKTATAYYKAHIGEATSIKALVGDYRLLSYTLNAYGLGDQINSRALIAKVLEGGVASSKSLANTLPNANWKAFATAFDFVGKGASSVTSASAVATTTADYVVQQLESDQGTQSVGVQLALYFQRVAPTVKDEYGVLADSNLVEVARTIFGLPTAVGTAGIDAQAKALSRLMPISDLQDPKALTRLVERFTAMYDANYGPSSGSTTSLTVKSGNSAAPASAAATILAGIVSANGQTLASALSAFTSASKPTLSTALVSSLQRFTLGG